LLAAVALKGSPAMVLGYYVGGRVLYVLTTALLLRTQFLHRSFTRRWGPEGGFLRFRSIVSVVMNHDAACFIVLCWTSRDVLPRTSLPQWAAWTAGGALILGGFLVKFWAVATIGKNSYFWEAFFFPPQDREYSVSGPYRWFMNPMYTVGYLPCYGLALAFYSVDGLLAAVFAQATILTMCALIEVPHTRALQNASRASARSGLSATVRLPLPQRNAEPSEE
jgi:protein-S-isoprenylcysteine O-methyltransferase Ste14